MIRTRPIIRDSFHAPDYEVWKRSVIFRVSLGNERAWLTRKPTNIAHWSRLCAGHDGAHEFARSIYYNPTRYGCIYNSLWQRSCAIFVPAGTNLREPGSLRPRVEFNVILRRRGGALDSIIGAIIGVACNSVTISFRW